MSRSLHYNPRNYKEPFYLVLNEIQKINGVEILTEEKKVLMFGNIRNKIATANEAYNNRLINYLSIKIVKPNIELKEGLRIFYRNNVYVITSIEYDLYSYSEMILNCELEDENNVQD